MPLRSAPHAQRHLASTQPTLLRDAHTKGPTAKQHCKFHAFQGWDGRHTTANNQKLRCDLH
eukprot:3296862-Amphidinium_carterae.1